jgi:hypothetical protein
MGCGNSNTLDDNNKYDKYFLLKEEIKKNIHNFYLRKLNIIEFKNLLKKLNQFEDNEKIINEFLNNCILKKHEKYNLKQIINFSLIRLQKVFPNGKNENKLIFNILKFIYFFFCNPDIFDIKNIINTIDIENEKTLFIKTLIENTKCEQKIFNNVKKTLEKKIKKKDDLNEINLKQSLLMLSKFSKESEINTNNFTKNSVEFYHSGKFSFLLVNMIQFCLFMFIYLIVAPSILHKINNFNDEEIQNIFINKKISKDLISNENLGENKNVDIKKFNEYIYRQMQQINININYDRLLKRLLVECLQPISEIIIKNVDAEIAPIENEEMEKIIKKFIYIFNVSKFNNKIFPKIKQKEEEN